MRYYDEFDCQYQMTADEFQDIFLDHPNPDDIYNKWKDSGVPNFSDFWEQWTASQMKRVTGAEVIDRENVKRESGEGISDVVERYKGEHCVLREPLGSQNAPDSLYISGQRYLKVENKSSTGNTATMNSAVINPKMLYFFFRRPKNRKKVHLSYFRTFYGGDFWDQSEKYAKMKKRISQLKKEVRTLLSEVYPDCYDEGFTNSYPRLKHKDPKMNHDRFKKLEQMLEERKNIIDITHEI